MTVEHDHEHCIDPDSPGGVIAGCPDFGDPLPYPCPRCDEEFVTSGERVDHLVSEHGEAHQ